MTLTDKQSHSVLSSVPVQNIELTSHETVNNREMSDKLTVIIEKQDAILEALQVGNNLLQEICQRLNERNV